MIIFSQPIIYQFPFTNVHSDYNYLSFQGTNLWHIFLWQNSVGQALQTLMQ